MSLLFYQWSSYYHRSRILIQYSTRSNILRVEKEAIKEFLQTIWFRLLRVFGSKVYLEISPGHFSTWSSFHVNWQKIQMYISVFYSVFFFFYIFFDKSPWRIDIRNEMWKGGFWLDMQISWEKWALHCGVHTKYDQTWY